MIRYPNLIVLVLMLVSAGCSSGQNKESVTNSVQLNIGDTQENAIIGKWTNSTIDVDLFTFNNSDTSFHVSINEDNWEMKMNIKPVITELKPNGTFLNNYLDTLGNIFHSNAGVWYIDGDSLFLEEESGDIYPFKVIVNGDLMEMTTTVDYDEDGKKDDQYFGTYKRIND